MAQSDTPPPLVVRDLSIERGGQHLFSGLSFALDPGAILVLRGPNGSGKTSLLRVLAGIGAAATGTVCTGSCSHVSDPSGYAQAVAYWGHRDGFKDTQTALKALCQWQSLSGHPLTQQKALALLARVGLEERADFPIRTFSAGQRRRLGLARLLARQATVWLLDEPFTALDDDGKALLSQMITQHRAAGGVIVAALHDAFDGVDVQTLRLGMSAAGEAA